MSKLKEQQQSRSDTMMIVFLWRVPTYRINALLSLEKPSIANRTESSPTILHS